ncbi:macro domain-containing protein [Alkalimonas sp. NCh-2]|uniref:type II toxin-antitoxin system antitoxin DNA ADP-ribosyl glycohydrolase DarG n=1 Tax=Alkalimonas sp. NCh-2 TaxID=3144846 RepID=UPI0031F704A0
MIIYTQGNLLEANVEALVNTVNTVGVMGKGIALMFKERFPANMAAYAKACKADEVKTGKMFVTETGELMGPRWIINFPTKQHWRARSQIQWIIDGLADLRRVIEQHHIRSIAIPPLGAGNGGLSWDVVKPHIEQALAGLDGVEVVIFEPAKVYQNVAKTKGVEKLTPARALIAELVRRYWVLGMECSLLEIQKLAWFLERVIDAEGLKNPLDLQFKANNYGPYADRLRHLLDSLDGSYLKSDKRISDSEPWDTIWFNDAKRKTVEIYLKSEAREYLPALEKTAQLIDGFESPFGMELLATVDWLLARGHVASDVESVRQGVRHWPGGERSAQRKLRLFDPPKLELALERLKQVPLPTPMIQDGI